MKSGNLEWIKKHETQSLSTIFSNYPKLRDVAVHPAGLIMFDRRVSIAHYPIRLRCSADGDRVHL